jgi:predicted SAM-dependent methyltransferase
MNSIPGSETSTAVDVLKPYCEECEYLLDIGFGGFKVAPHAWTFDLPNPYVKLPNDRQILRGDCQNLSMFCDGALDGLHSSHVVEDFTYHTLTHVILPEWRRVLKEGGLLLVQAPDQQRFLRHIKKTNQGDNLAHKEQDFSIHTFKKCLGETGNWNSIFEEPRHGEYSWIGCWKKI